jgi:acetyltransferase-like isoleucine patch superfamily enzyme
LITQRLGSGGCEPVYYDFVNLYGCEIGDDSRIGTFVEIQRGARIGGRQPGAIVAGKPGARREITRGA